MNRSILLLFAHPDDESFGLGGTVARYSAAGIIVDLVCATRGEKGTRLGIPDGVDTGSVRERELRAAAAVIGIRNIYFLDYTDGELADADGRELAEKVANIMKELQPEVVITFGEDGITGHPDHIAIGRATTAACNRLKASGYPRKLYYVTVPASAVPDGAASGIATRPDYEITTTIDIAAYLEPKIRSISAHRSQQDTYQFIDMLKDAGSPFSKHEFLYLVDSKPGTKETDLFQ